MKIVAQNSREWSPFDQTSSPSLLTCTICCKYGDDFKSAFITKTWYIYVKNYPTRVSIHPFDGLKTRSGDIFKMLRTKLMSSRVKSSNISHNKQPYRSFPLPENVRSPTNSHEMHDYYYTVEAIISLRKHFFIILPPLRLNTSSYREQMHCHDEKNVIYLVGYIYSVPDVSCSVYNSSN